MVKWLGSAGPRPSFWNSALDQTIRGSVTFAGYYEDDFADAGRRRISDGVMVLWPRIRDRKDVYS
jgi:hypothetical protein